MATAGQINRHKNQQERRDEHPTKRHSWAPVRGAPYGRARGRAGRTVPPVRNRTLVLNNPVPSASSVEASPLSDLNSALSDGATPNVQPVLTQTWVSKNDRHKQLINPAVYEKEREGRMRDLEHTRQLKLAHKDERERSKIQRHLQKFSRPTPDQGSSHEVLVGGVPFRVSHGGSRLVKTSGEASLTNVAPRRPLIALANAAFAGDTPKRTVVGGVTFLRSKHGNLYRSGMVKNKKCVEARLQARLWPFDPQDELKKEEKKLTVLKPIWQASCSCQEEIGAMQALLKHRYLFFPVLGAKRPTLDRSPTGYLHPPLQGAARSKREHG